ncbi:thaumatin [Globomyces pollinis-pini]|nr:thaumatin [Globomyces pollinis-pini]
MIQTLIALFLVSANAQRTMTLTNNCPSKLWFKFISGASQPGSCGSDGDCIAGSECNKVAGICFWKLPKPSTGNFHLDPHQKSSVTFPLIDNRENILWSGKVGACLDGTCLESEAKCDKEGCDVPYGSPMTIAEWTFLKKTEDFYDVSTINGFNIGVAMKPLGVNPTVENPYRCGTPGGRESKGLGGSTYNFQPPLLEYNWVSTGGKTCNSQADCTSGETCGLSNNVGVAQRLRKSCGKFLGYWTANQICGIQPDYGAPFNCRELRSLQLCDNGIQSCYSMGAGSGCCGCANWDQEGLNVPGAAITHQCYNKNPVWTQNILPTLKWLKKEVPTLYTYPYDDASSTFTCSNVIGGANKLDYEIIFCP